MTEKKDSAGDDDKTAAELYPQLFGAYGAVAALTNAELDDVVIGELTRRVRGRRVEPGLLQAVRSGIHALLDIEIVSDAIDAEGEMVERIAAVGRGASIKTETTAHKTRAIVRYMELLKPWRVGPRIKAKMLAEALEIHFRCKVEPKKIESALSKRGSRQRLQWVAHEVGIETTEDGIKSALKKR